MTTIGQLCLLIGDDLLGLCGLCSDRRGGAQRVAPWSRMRGLGRSAVAAAVAAAALTAVVAVLAYALVTKDLRFEYVTQYSDPLLPWQYSLSALWVGQAGSLLVWGWFIAVLAVIFRFTFRRGPGELRELAFGTQMTYLAFLRPSWSSPPIRWRRRWRRGREAKGSVPCSNIRPC